MPENRPQNQVSFELLWWVFTLVLAALVVAPIYTQIPDFPFYLPNIVYVIVAVTFTRYLFFLDISWLRDRIVLQGLIGVAVVPLIFYLVQEFNYFVIFFDENGPDTLVSHLPADRQEVMDSYMKIEYRFFGVWAITAAALTPFRLIYNAWVRYRGVGRK